MNKKGFRVHRDPWSFGDAVHILRYEERDGKVFVDHVMERKELDPGGLVDLASTWHVSSDEAQQLIDGLWEAGLRPTAGHGSAGQLGATEKHLEDMRKLVFKIYGGDS